MCAFFLATFSFLFTLENLIKIIVIITFFVVGKLVVVFADVDKGTGQVEVLIADTYDGLLDKEVLLVHTEKVV